MSDILVCKTGKMVGGADSIMGLTAVAVAHALVVAVVVSAGLHLSGAHINPAVTLGLAVGGHITIIRSILYWIVQLLASSLACLLLKYLTNGMVYIATPSYALHTSVICIYLRQKEFCYALNYLGFWCRRLQFTH